MRRLLAMALVDLLSHSSDVLVVVFTPRLLMLVQIFLARTNMASRRMTIATLHELLTMWVTTLVTLLVWVLTFLAPLPRPLAPRWCWLPLRLCSRPCLVLLCTHCSSRP